MPSTARIGPEIIRFLKQLKKNNNREWFQKNKDRYEHDVREPLLKFIEAFGPAPREDQPALRGRRVTGWSKLSKGQSGHVRSEWEPAISGMNDVSRARPAPLNHRKTP